METGTAEPLVRYETGTVVLPDDLEEVELSAPITIELTVVPRLEAGCSFLIISCLCPMALALADPSYALPNFSVILSFHGFGAH